MLTKERIQELALALASDWYNADVPPSAERIHGENIEGLAARACEVITAAVLEDVAEGRRSTPVDQRLPAPHTEVLWWHTKHGRWYTGWLDPLTGDHAPGYFTGTANAYVFDGGVSHWMPLPTNPNRPKRS